MRPLFVSFGAKHANTPSMPYPQVWLLHILISPCHLSPSSLLIFYFNGFESLRCTRAHSLDSSTPSTSHTANSLRLYLFGFLSHFMCTYNSWQRKYRLKAMHTVRYNPIHSYSHRHSVAKHSQSAHRRYRFGFFTLFGNTQNQKKKC